MSLWVVVFYQRKEKEQRDKSTKQDTRDTLEAKKEADRIFSEKQQLKAQRMREDERKLQDFRVAQTVTSKTGCVAPPGKCASFIWSLTFIYRILLI